MLHTKFRQNWSNGSGEEEYEGFLAQLSQRLIGELIVVVVVFFYSFLSFLSFCSIYYVRFNN